MLLAVLVAAPTFATEEPLEAPTVVIFYQPSCSSCERLDEYLAPFVYRELPAESIVKHDISSPEAVALQGEFLAAYRQGKFSVPLGAQAQVDGDRVDYPLIFIGDKILAGMSVVNERAISDAIVRCYREGCTSPMEIVYPPIPWSEILRLAAFAGLAILLIILQPL